MSEPPRIVIAAGGTAGHVVPAIAVADALRAEGAEVSFVGGERAEAELVPAGRLRAGHAQRRGHQPHEPAEGRPRARQGRALRSDGARKILKRNGGPTPSSAAAATSPARSGSRRRWHADPARARRGRLAPRPHQPRAGAARAPRLPRVPARRPRRRPLPRHRPPRPAARSPTARTPAPSSASAPTRPACSCSAARSAPARSTTRRPPRSRTRPTASSTSPARATTPTLDAPGPHYVLLEYLTPFGIALAAADAAVARAGGSVFELAQYGLPVAC